MLIKSDLYEAEGVDQPQGIVVGLSGFTTGSSGRMFSRDPEDSDVGGIISAISHLPVERVILGYDQTEKAINQITTFKEDFPDGKVVLIGHSRGGDNIFNVAQALEEKGIAVNLLVPIDSVGFDDNELPGNVLVGVNYFSTSKDGFNGQSEIQGAVNIGIDGTTHTKIDGEITNQIIDLIDYAVSGTSSNSNLFGSSLTTSDQSTPANDILPEPQTLGPLFSIPPSLFNPIGSSLSQEETPQVEQIAPLSDNQIQTTQSATANQSAPNNQIVEDQSTDFFETTGLVDETELHPELENSESTQVTFASENASSLQNPPIESLSAGDSSTIEESDDISASAPASFDENPDSIALEEPTTPALEVESDQPDMLLTEPVEGHITDGLSDQSASNVEFNQADFDGQTLVSASLDTTPTDSTFENDSAATHSELVGTEPETESPEQTLALDQPQPSMDQPGAEELSSQVNTDDASWFAENTPMLDSPVAEAQQPEVAPVLDNVLLDAPPAIEISEPETPTLSGTEDFSVAPTSEMDSWENPDSPDFELEPLSNPNLETGAMATDTELAEVTPEVEATLEPVAFDQVQEFGDDQPSDPVSTNDVNWFAENTPMLDSPTVDAEPPEITSHDLFASTPSSFEPSEASVPNIFAETPSVFESTEPASPDVFAATPSVFNETPTQTDLFTSTPSVFESPAPSTPDVFADTPSVFETATTQTDLFTSTPSVFESGETSSSPGSAEIPSAFETTPPQTDLFVNAPSVFESVESSTPDAFANTPSVFEVPGDQTSTDLFATTPSAFEIPESSTPDVFADTPSAFEIGPETSNPFDNADSVFDAPDVFSNVPSAFDAPGTTPANLFADTGPETNFDLSPEWSDHSLESFDSSIDFDFSSGIEDIPELSVSADAFSDYSDYSLPDVSFDTPSFDVSDYDVVTYDSPSDTSSSVDMSFPDVGSVDSGEALSSE